MRLQVPLIARDCCEQRRVGRDTLVWPTINQSAKALSREHHEWPSFSSLQEWLLRTIGVTYPEAEFRQIAELKPGGRVAYREEPRDAVTAGTQKFTRIPAPTLALFVREGRRAQAFEKGVPGSRVIVLPFAHHYVFLSNESDVLREMRIFLLGLR